MTKLTKTQQTLLDRAQTHGGAAAVVAGSGRGARGGRLSFGSRELDAMYRLAEMGLVRITHRDTDNDYRQGYCVRVSSFRYEIA